MQSYNRDDPGLVGGALRAPCKVAALQTQSPVLHVPSTNADRVHALRANLGAGRLPSKLELSLFAVMGALGTGLRAFVTR